MTGHRVVSLYQSSGPQQFPRTEAPSAEFQHRGFPGPLGWLQVTEKAGLNEAAPVHLAPGTCAFSGLLCCKAV